MAQKFSESKASGKHHLLSRLVGEWKGTTKIWLNADGEPEEAPIQGSFKEVLGGRFILHEYNWRFHGKPHDGMMLFGYHLSLEKFQNLWIDSFHTGTDMMLSESKRGDEEFCFLGSYAYVTPETEQHWGWRTHVEFVNDDEIRMTAYNISPDRQETKGTETVYRRES